MVFHQKRAIYARNFLVLSSSNDQAIFSFEFLRKISQKQIINLSCKTYF